MVVITENSPLQDNKKVRKISLSVYEHLKELEKEIIQEFIETLKNNVINPYETTVLLGEKFVFVYTGARRYKYVTQLKFLVLSHNEIKNIEKKKYRRTIGKIYFSVRVKGD